MNTSAPISIFLGVAAAGIALIARFGRGRKQDGIDETHEARTFYVRLDPEETLLFEFQKKGVPVLTVYQH